MDLNYMFLRQQVERSLAERASGDAARRAHAELARQYELEIERQTGGRIMFARSVRDHPISARPTLSASS
jgi:hypothetical protein